MLDLSVAGRIPISNDSGVVGRKLGIDEWLVHTTAATQPDHCQDQQAKMCYDLDWSLQLSAHFLLKHLHLIYGSVKRSGVEFGIDSPIRRTSIAFRPSGILAILPLPQEQSHSSPLA